MSTISTDKLLVSPSIIASDLSIMGDTAADLSEAGVDLWHMDVMDGHFVPNLTYGPAYLRDFQKHTSIPLDCHLMIENPENWIDSYIKLKPWCITIHYESTKFPARTLKEIRSAGIIAGLALNPGTPVEVLRDLLPYIDMVLIMSVDPGFYGQSYMPEAASRIKRVKAMSEEMGLGGKVKIQVDGGISTENIADVVRAGANVIVAGSSAFKDGKVAENIQKLRLSAK